MWLVRSTDIVHIVYDVFLRIVSVRNTVYARLSGVTVRAGLTDKWETRIIQNIYFIEPRTKNKTIIYLLYTLYVHTHTHMYVCVCVYVYIYIYIYIYTLRTKDPCRCYEDSGAALCDKLWVTLFRTFVCFFFHGSAAPSGPGPLHFRSFEITLRHTTLGRTTLDEW